MNKAILILEDDLKTIATLLNLLADFFVINKENNEMERVSFDVTVITDSVKANNLLRNVEDDNFDLILLDRDCYSGGSFHSTQIDKFNPKKIISISAVTAFNEEARDRYGIDRCVEKTQGNLEDFAQKVILVIREMLDPGMSR